MWYPDIYDINMDELDITFHLPPDMQISTPWNLIAEGNNIVTYRHQNRPFQWQGRIAIGQFKNVIKKLGSTRIQVSILNGHVKTDTEAVMHWVDKNLEALMLIYGEFPVPGLQLLVVPLGRDREPVRWGQAMRGGGDAVHVYIDQTRSLKTFLEDWVLIHELSHLLHPRFEDASWLAEGIASYYQNVLRARGGMLSEQRAWQKLHEGFQRGIRGTPPDKSLQQVSESMMRTKSYMRVYWSGAAISLLADYELRKISNNKQSLDTALQKLSRCCLPASRFWSGYAMMNKLDSLTQTNVFTSLYKQHLPSKNFPELSNVYFDLGLTTENGSITFDNDADYAKIRKSMMSHN